MNEINHVPNSRAFAIQIGSNKYFTGQACKHGHTAARYTHSGTCEMCIKMSSEKGRTNRTERLNGELSQFVATNLRVSPSNYSRVLELAFNLTRIRYPTALLSDIEHRKGGRDSQGGLLLYTLHLHPADAPVIQAYAHSLIPKVDIEAVRARVLGGVQQLVDLAVCAEPEFRP